MEDFELELKLTFLEEAQQLLDDAESAFIALDAGDRSSELVDKIFRLAHNFKGSAMAVGFDGLSQLAHKLEDVLSSISKKQLEPTPAVCTVLLAALDALKQQVSGLKKDLSFVLDTSALVQDLISLRSQPDQVPRNPQTSQIIQTESKHEGEPMAAAAVPPQKNAQTEDESIRVATKKLDQLINFIGELVVQQSILKNHRLQETLDTEASVQVVSYMEKIIHEIQGISMALRMVPVKPVFQKMQRTVRDLSASQGKTIDFVTEGEHVEIDKTVLDRITDPLTHLIRNAIDHGIETREQRALAGKPPVARVVLKVAQQEDRILISITDDGRGMDKDRLIVKAFEKGLLESGTNLSDEEAYQLIFKSGFSTREEVTDVSGRGVGMDVVKRSVEDLKGSIQIQTQPGAGSTFVITLPLSLSVITGMIVQVEDRKYVVPVTQLLETIELGDAVEETVYGGNRVLNFRGETLPLISLAEALGSKEKRGTAASGLIVAHAGGRFTFEVDRILGEQQIVLKKLGKEVRGIPGVMAGAILGTGEPGLVLSLYELIQERSPRAAA